MFNNKQEFFDHLRSAPNPKELRKQFLEELQEDKKNILEFRNELKKIIEERSPAPKVDEAKISETQKDKAEYMVQHMEKVTEDLVHIAENFTSMALEGKKSSDIIRRF